MDKSSLEELLGINTNLEEARDLLKHIIEEQKQDFNKLTPEEQGAKVGCEMRDHVVILQEVYTYIENATDRLFLFDL